MIKEIWKDLTIFKKGKYNGLYQVSSYGRMRSLDRCTKHISCRAKDFYRTYKGKILKPIFNKNGYVQVTLNLDGLQKIVKVHNIVLTEFTKVDGQQNKMQCNHRDLNPSNNNIENLEWLTQEENMRHLRDFGENKHHKLNWDKVNKIRETYKLGDSTHRSLAEDFNMSKGQITNILNYKKWKAPYQAANNQ